ncbi:hypothetical protein KFL_005580080 [Klebsormidium nitens]|uniref:Uncharacterized protein n=1 Tax=Klebsormidium nitens TaxID=105231 RepID=A0A0U9HTM8_KLENI|nr:hypothetical protein KFL_005580080 [Klebsormidium nitens]|eukprot:GAQ89756.1 hypothetical protein KFL_005580080 [Klebsormidium nitens]
MRRESFKRGRIRVCSSVFSFPLGGSPINPKPKEWYTQIVYDNRPLAHPTGVRGSGEAAYALCPKRTNFSYETGKCGRPRCPGGRARARASARGDESFFDPDWVVPVRNGGGLRGGVGPVRGDVSQDWGDVSGDGEGDVRVAGSLGVDQCGSEVCKEEWLPARRPDVEDSEACRSGALLVGEINESEDYDWEFVNGGDGKSDAGSAVESDGSWGWL